MLLTILSDALHSLPFSGPKIQSERYYYTVSKRFEQSLDIYRPPPKKTTSSDETLSSSPPPIVALVVGSAWLGHRSFVYSGTSWWNSSGPKTVANLGCVCVCIRHRGAFMQTFNVLTLTFIAVMVALIATILNAVIHDHWNTLEEIFGEDRKDYLTVALVSLLTITGLLLMQLGGIGAAQFDDMQQDVVDALAWLHANESRLGLKVHSKAVGGKGEESIDTTTKTSKRVFIFGGYSSGGHVAATVTQRPELWKDRNMPAPDSTLYISPVLSTKSYQDVLLKQMSSLSSSTSLPSLAPSTSSEQLSRQSSVMSDAAVSSLSSLSSTSSPTWLTNQVVKAVFGSNEAHKVPSPVHTYEKSPSIPHIFLGCRKEMFGLTWLDTFFCSPSYSELLNSVGIESRYTAVESDHWNILNSTELSDALKRELEWVEQKVLQGLK